MGKIGRNDPCPCGSGKKYKHCHLNMKDGNFGSSQIKVIPVNSLTQLVLKYNSVQILGLLASLQLYPINHGRNFRFEQLCRETLLNFDPKDQKPLATWEMLKTIIENYTFGASQEDPLSNAFTETAIFENGNYIVYPGIFEGHTDLLNLITECIFLRKNTLNTDFVEKIRNAVGLLLYMSDSVAQEIKQVSYIYQEGTTENIEFPDYNTAIQYTDAVYYSKESLEKVCKLFGYDISIIDDFCIEPTDKDLKEDDPDKNVVNLKPIIKVDNDIILYMPTGILNSLINYVYIKAKEYDCYDELMELINERQFQLSLYSLHFTGWISTDIKLPNTENMPKIKEAVFQFDNQKLAYISYVEPGALNDFADSGQQMGDLEKIYVDRTNQVVEYLSTLNKEQTYNIFCLYILGETNQDCYFPWFELSNGNYSLALKFRELLTITQAPEANTLTLWKFAKCYSRTSGLTHIISAGGTLDVYSIYRKNQGSLLASDDPNPFGSLLIVVNGSSNEFKREVQKRQNVHAVPIFYNQQIAYAKVSRFRDYAPIYIEKTASEYFRIVIENYKIPIWITCPQVTDEEENLSVYFCEAVAFWLNKMTDLLAPYINQQDFVSFEIEFDIDEKLLNGTEYELKTVEIDLINFTSEIKNAILRIKVPSDFLYAGISPDNIADKLLMKVVLNGLVNFIKAAGRTTELSSEIIEEIIEEIMQPPTAKMLLFSDAYASIEMDPRNLPPIQYIKETDVSNILENLVSYLPNGYVIPVNIQETAEKTQLCNDIVTALIKELTEKIKEFDGNGLLKWLVKINEKFVQTRSFNEILIPAKIACFSDYETEIKNLLDGEKNLATSSLAVRTLIEFVASKIPFGSKWPNFDDIGELLALTEQLINWGSLSDTIYFGMNDPEMGLLPSGRIGTEKKLEVEAFKPFALAKTESIIFKNIENFNENYIPNRKVGNATPTEENTFLDIAFKAEYGISLTLLMKILGELINKSLSNAVACMEISENEIRKLLKNIEGIESNEIDIALNLLTLLERDRIGVPPIGYKIYHIFPWRFNRSISYLRRPLIRVNQNNETYYYYGYRHLIQYKDHLLYLLYSSKLPDANSGEMKKWLAAKSSERGNPFRQAVKEWFEQNSDWEVIQHEIKMEKNVSALHITTDKNYGDIDLMVIDHTNHMIYSIECKNIQGGRNIYEMKAEMDEYLGKEEKDNKAKILKHVRRDEWLQKNKSAISNLVHDVENYELKSLILTADEIPLAYLKKHEIPLEIKSFPFLRKHGLSYFVNNK